MKRVIKSIACLNFIEINGNRYKQPQNSKLCCWEEVKILSKDKSIYPKWIIILSLELDITEVWKVDGV